MSCSTRAAANFFASSGFTGEAFHCRALEEKTCMVFAPAATARSTAVQTPPLVPTFTPIRFLAIAVSVSQQRVWSSRRYCESYLLYLSENSVKNISTHSAHPRSIHVRYSKEKNAHFTESQEPHPA